MLDLALISKPLIMGILNVTPDSFSDGGRFQSLDSAVKQAELLLNEGADMLDIGGESTRPKSLSVSSGEQIARIIPVIKAIRSQISSDVLISVDTRLSTVAKAALNAGANWINDISAGRDDPLILKIAAEMNCPIVLMHIRGTPQTMQDSPYYENPVKEVLAELNHRIEIAIDAGIRQQQIIIDPGIGFGKRHTDNWQLLANLSTFVKSGFPVLLGTSRKRFLGQLCDIDQADQLGNATAITTALGVQAGVKIFRVHDVKLNRQALEIAWKIYQTHYA